MSELSVLFCSFARVCDVQLLWLAGVQVDLINLLDLQMLQGNDEEDEGLDLATVATDHDVRPEVDGQEGDKFDSEFLMFPSSVFGHQYRNLLCLYTRLFCRISTGHYGVKTLGKFFTPMCLCHQAV